jgi:WD40 repeat protein
MGLQTLEAVARELRRESHNLVHHPHLLWQQLCNRLQWLSGGGELDDSFVSRFASECEDRRSSPGNRWLKLLTRFRESRALVRTLPGHDGLVSCCAFSPDGKLLVSSSWDNTLKVWKCDTGGEIATLRGHEDQVTSCDVSPDGRLVASSSYDETIIIWRLDALQSVRVLRGHKGRVLYCAFSPDGKVLASVGEDSTARLWDVDTGRELRVAKGLGLCKSVTFSPDGRQVLLGASLWASTLTRRLKTFQTLRDSGAACFSPDGRLIARGCLEGTVAVWDAASGEQIADLSGHQDLVNACAFSPDGETLVSASGGRFSERESKLILWEVGTWQKLAHLHGHTGAVESCAFSPTGDVLASASADGSLKFWQPEVDGHAREENIPDYVYTASFSPNGESLLCGYRNEGLVLRDAASGELRASLAGHRGGVYRCVYSPQGDCILSASGDGTLRLWDADTMQETRVLVAEDDPEFDRFHSCTFSPDGELIAAVLRYAGAHMLHIWRKATGEELLNEDADGEPESFAADFPCGFSPDGTLFVSGSHKRMILRDPATGEDIIDNMGSCSGAYSFSPDGKLLAQADQEKKLEVFVISDLLEGDWEEIVLEEHEHPVESCAFSPDGGLLASGDRGGVLGVWNVRSRTHMWSARAHSASVSGCWFSPDGRLLVSAGHDKAVRIWRAAEPVEEGAFFCLGAGARVAFSRGGRRLCCTDDGGNLYLLELLGFER